MTQLKATKHQLYMYIMSTICLCGCVALAIPYVLVWRGRGLGSFRGSLYTGERENGLREREGGKTEATQGGERGREKEGRRDGRREVYAH